MTTLYDILTGSFLPAVLPAMLLNFEIATIALVGGLAFGILLAFGRAAGGPVRFAVVTLIGLMRAAPTFVVMFFLINAIPRDATLFGLSLDISAFMAVSLSLLPYSAAYIADAAVEAMRQLRSGSRLGALLFMPNVMRAYFVLVMSSSTGAAIGVNEGISAIIDQASQLASLGEQLVLYFVGIILFGVPLQAAFALIRLGQLRLSRRAHLPPPSGVPPRRAV